MWDYSDCALAIHVNFELEMTGNDTEADRLLQQLKNRPAIAWMVVLSALVIGLASFLEAIGKLGLLDLISTYPEISGGVGAGILITLFVLWLLIHVGVIGRRKQSNGVDENTHNDTGISRAHTLIDKAKQHSLGDRNDRAREAYGEARTLYKAVGDRLGEANVLRGLGDLERKLGRNDQAREAYGEARTLYKAVENRLGEANVLLGLGRTEADTDPELARRHLYQAAHLYEAIGMLDWHQSVLDEAAKLKEQ
jgi:tetratricopeptide (TPR) repeat protein